MFRIRAVHDDLHPASRGVLDEVERILAQQFPGLGERQIASIREDLVNPFAKRFRSVVYVAENERGRVLGFAILMHDPVVGFCLLDFIASRRGLTSRGIGGALYDRVRDESSGLRVGGLFFECLPDEPDRVSNPDVVRANAARLRFYENWGARPIIGTEYERPLRPGGKDMPYLVYDDLGTGQPLRRGFLKRVIRAILERKYADVVPAGYVDAVVASVRDDPVQLRPLRYVRAPQNGVARDAASPARAPAPGGAAVPLVINASHDIHHVRERGYVEAPVRIPAILRELLPSGMFVETPPRPFARRFITAVHHAEYVRYLETVCMGLKENDSVYPYVFPIRNATRPPKELALRAGYYCLDTFTPLSKNAFLAAERAAHCALTAAEEVARGRRFAYALVRPPGHHAERAAFGGFCYFNNSAIAAQRLAALGRVAVLDIDYHHGNGTQQIFLERNDVLTVSIHGHPSFAYPYFSGFAEERGVGEGEGFNLNLPLPEQQTGAEYRKALARALRRIEDHRPDFLVVALGVDTARGDPTGSWTLGASDFHANGKMIAEMGLPTAVIQEGGYRTRTLGTNVRAFFQGLASAAEARPKVWSWLARAANGPKRAAALPSPSDATPLITVERKPMAVSLRREPRADDPEKVRQLATSTGFFYPEEVDVAVELVEERLAKGDASEYWFVFADGAEGLLGYACYGPVSMTKGSWDLYWIAVHPRAQGRGVGGQIIEAVEGDVAARGGNQIFAETAGRAQYEPTRAFYRSRNYTVIGEFPDFYAPGDAKITFAKRL